eukprot:GHVS01062720.1.p1 GENE.GHVS01062720.1~~GHVS01062720.1.p1  ORF type:complete len:2062 (+),score=234.43 GHVS01062720.1:169-6186(+)
MSANFKLPDGVASLTQQHPTGIYIQAVAEWFRDSAIYPAVALYPAAEVFEPHKLGVLMKMGRGQNDEDTGFSFTTVLGLATWNQTFPDESPARLMKNDVYDGRLLTGAMIHNQLIAGVPFPYGTTRHGRAIAFKDAIEAIHSLTEQQLNQINGNTGITGRSGFVHWHVPATDYATPSIVARMQLSKAPAGGVVMKISARTAVDSSKLGNLINSVNSNWGTSTTLPAAMARHCPSQDVGGCLQYNPWLTHSVDMFSFERSYRNYAKSVSTLMYLLEQTILADVTIKARAGGSLMIPSAAADLFMADSAIDAVGQPKTRFQDAFQGLAITPVGGDTWVARYSADPAQPGHLSAGTNFVLNGSNFAYEVTTGSARDTVAIAVANGITIMGDSSFGMPLPVSHTAEDILAGTLFSGYLGTVKVSLAGANGMVQSISMKISDKTVDLDVAYALGLMDQPLGSSLAESPWLNPLNFRLTFAYAAFWLRSLKSLSPLSDAIDRPVYLGWNSICSGIKSTPVVEASYFAISRDPTSGAVRRSTLAATPGLGLGPTVISTTHNKSLAIEASRMCEEARSRGQYINNAKAFAFVHTTVGLPSSTLVVECMSHVDGAKVAFRVTVAMKSEAQTNRIMQEVLHIRDVSGEEEGAMWFHNRLSTVRSTALKMQVDFMQAVGARRHGYRFAVPSMLSDPWYLDTLEAGLIQIYRVAVMKKFLTEDSVVANIEMIRGANLNVERLNGQLLDSLSEAALQSYDDTFGYLQIKTTDDIIMSPDGVRIQLEALMHSAINGTLPHTATSGAVQAIAQTSTEADYTIAGLYGLVAVCKQAGHAIFPTVMANTFGELVPMNEDLLGALRSLKPTFTSDLFFNAVVSLEFDDLVTVTVKPAWNELFAGNLDPLSEAKLGTFMAMTSIIKSQFDIVNPLPDDIMRNIKHVDTAQQGLMDMVMTVKAVAAASPLLGEYIAAQKGGVFTKLSPQIENEAMGLLMDVSSESDATSSSIFVSFGRIGDQRLSLKNSTDSVLVEHLRNVIRNDAHLYSLYPSVIVGHEKKNTRISPSHKTRTEQNEVLTAFAERLPTLNANNVHIPSFSIKGDNIALTVKLYGLDVKLSTYEEVGHASYKAANKLVLLHKQLRLTDPTVQRVLLIDWLRLSDPASYRYGSPEAQSAVYVLPVHIELQNMIQMVVGPQNNDELSNATWKYPETFFAPNGYIEAARNRYFVTSDEDDPTVKLINVAQRPDNEVPSIASWSAAAHWALTKKVEYGNDTDANWMFAIQLLVAGYNDLKVDYWASSRTMGDRPHSISYLSPINISSPQTGTITIGTRLSVQVNSRSSTDKNSIADDWISLGQYVNRIINTHHFQSALTGKRLSDTSAAVDALVKLAAQAQLYTVVYANSFLVNPLNVGTADRATHGSFRLRVTVEGKDGAAPALGDNLFDLTTVFVRTDTNYSGPTADTFGQHFYSIPPPTATVAIMGRRWRVMSNERYAHSLLNAVVSPTFSHVDTMDLPPLHAYTTTDGKDELSDLTSRGQIRMTMSAGRWRFRYRSVDYDYGLPIGLAFEKELGRAFNLATYFSMGCLLSKLAGQLIVTDSLINSKTIEGHIARESSVRPVIVPKQLGKPAYTEQTVVDNNRSGFARVESAVDFTKDDGGERRGLKSGTVVLTEVPAQTDLSDAEINNDDFKAILSMVTPRAAAGVFEVVGVNATYALDAALIIAQCFDLTVNIDDLLFVPRPIDGQMGERDSMRLGGLVSIEMVRHIKVVINVRKYWRSFHPLIMDVPAVAAVIRAFQSLERQHGQAHTVDYFGYPAYTVAKQGVFMALAAMHNYIATKQPSTTSFVTMMNKDGQHQSSFGRINPLPTPSTYAGDVVRLEANTPSRFSLLSLLPYDNNSMRNDQVERTHGPLFSSSLVSRYSNGLNERPNQMTPHQWEAFRRVLKSAGQSGNLLPRHRSHVVALLADDEPHFYQFGLSVCTRGSKCGFAALSREGRMWSSAKRLTVTGAVTWAAVVAFVVALFI